MSVRPSTRSARAPDRPAPSVDLYAQADARAAVRALLRTPLLHAGGHDDDLALVRRHRDEVERVLVDGLGYRLSVETGVARVHKGGPATGGVTRVLRQRSGAAFTPRRYAVLVLLLAHLGRTRRQVLASDVTVGVGVVAAEAGVGFDAEHADDRRAVHTALAALVDLGVVAERDGDLDTWADGGADCLLDVHRDRLATLAPTPVRDAAGPAALVSAATVSDDPGVAVRRRLVEEPLLTLADLTPEQQVWWRRHRHGVRDWLQTHVGLDLELRAEGALAVDRSDDLGELSDVGFPSADPRGRLALLLVDELVAAVRRRGRHLDGRAWVNVGPDPVAASTAAARRRLQTPDADAESAWELLVDVGLLRRHPDGWQLHAAAARYAATADAEERA